MKTLKKFVPTISRIRGLLMSHGHSMDDLAELLHISPRTLYNRLKREDWSIEEYLKIRQLLPDVSDDEILSAMMSQYKRKEFDPDIMHMTLAEVEALASKQQSLCKRNYSDKAQTSGYLLSTSNCPPNKPKKEDLSDEVL